MKLDDPQLEALAGRVAELVAERVPARGALVDAQAVAVYLDVQADWVRDHAALLGGRRLGEGPKAPFRFDLDEVDERLACSSSRGADPAAGRAAAPVQRHRRRRRLGTRPVVVPANEGEDGREGGR